MLAWLVGFVATALSIALGTQVLGWGVGTVLFSVAVANLAGFVALLTTLTLERQPWVRRNVMRGFVSTWAVFWLLSLGILYGLAPSLRDWHATRLLLLPLIASNGWMIPLFGLVQDAIVARGQRQARHRLDREPRSLSIPLFARAAWNAISFKSPN